MKSLLTVCLLFASAGLVAAQQYTISTVAGIPLLPGLYPQVNPTPSIPAASYTSPAIGPTTGGAQLYDPSVVFVDSKNNIYIANSYTYVVNMVTAATGIVTILGGDGTPGTAGDVEAATSANITDVHGIAVDSSGNIYISDTSSCRIRRIDNPATNTLPNISTFVGQSSFNNSATAPYCGAGANTPFTSPGAIIFDSKGNLYVTDRGSNSVRVVSSTGVVTTFAGTVNSYGYSGDGGPASKALLAYPVSLAMDTAGNLYIGDEGNSNIRKVDTTGNITTVATGVSAQSLAIDAAGNLYFVDGVSSAVKKILPGGGVGVIAGNGLPGYAGDGTFNGTIYTGSQASQAQLNQPEGLCFGPDGTLYVADTNNDVIRHLVLTPSSIGVQDAASDVPGSDLQPGSVSPGEILTLFGSGLGPSTLTEFTLGSNGAFPTQIAGTSVTFNGVSAPLIYTSTGLVAVVAPYEIVSSATATCVFAATAPAATPCANIVLSYQPAGTNVITQYKASVPVAAVTPSVFTANTTGSGPAAALNQNSTVNSAANPAHLGSTIVLFATGAGFMTNAVDGQTAPTNCGISCLATPQGTVTVKIGNQFVTPSYAGAAPAEVAGVMQVNAQIPTTIIPGAVLVEVLINGYPSQPGVTIAVIQ